MLSQTPAYPTFSQTLGSRTMEATPERVVAELDFRPDLQQGTGVFHAGAIMGLVDTIAAQCAALNAPPDLAPALAVQTVQFSSSLLRNSAGTIRAEAQPVQRGRNLIVIETIVRDAAQRQLVTITTTHLVLPVPAGGE